MTRSAIYRADLYAGKSKDVDELVRELEKAKMAEMIPPGDGRPEFMVKALEVAE